MSKPTRTQAEERFAATQKKQKQALKAQEKVAKERAEQIARLRAKRLAKDAGDAAGEG